MNRDQRAMQLFEQAVELAEGERAEFLDQVCAGDAELRAYVDSLIFDLRQSGGFLEQDPLSEHAAVEGQEDNPLSALSSINEMLQPGDVLCNRYRIVERIGLGGMGSVYRATDVRLDRDVAIKALHQATLFNVEIRQRFEREIKSVAALSHPNIVTLYDIAEHDGVPLAVMEHVAGHTLREHTERGLSLHNALRIARDVAAGLDAAHQLSVMHRDIKPENIMVTPGGIAKVLDFGLARRATVAVGQSLTATDQAPGTPPYMSPEQVLAQELGCPTDIFSLGTVLFETLTGKNPFRAASAMETMQRISQYPAPNITDFASAFPEELAALITAMLDRQVECRPTARSVCDRLNSFLSLSDLDLQVGAAAIGRHDSTLMQRESVTPPVVEPPTNLPLRSAVLTGRSAELMKLSEVLASCRVVTVLGPGGVGKTSLAYEAARQSRGHFPGGVWLCELASLRNADGVLEVLAGVLEGNAGAVNKLEEVVGRLDGERTLVVFDNCEHVIDAVAELVDRLSRQLPCLTVLITSREALKIAGEYVLRLEGLQHSDAAALFVARAAEQSGYQDDSQFDDLVKRIVKQLEGLPLAIELTAPKLAVMTLSELLEELNNQSATLRTGRRTGDRQSAIEQTIAWSFNLLAPDEQETLLALSVFTSWFTSEAAIEVSGLGPTAKMHLLRLVEQSVVARKEDQGRSRYRLLEPIRQFCQARTSHDQLGVARERHARFYAARAVVLGRGVSGFDEIECYHALNSEWPDLREAIAWGRKQQIAEVAIAPIVALASTGICHLRLEVFEWLISAEQELGEAIEHHKDAHTTLAMGYWSMGKPEVAEEYLQLACDRQVTPLALWTKAIIRFGQARFAEAADLWEQFQELANKSGDDVDRRWAASANSVLVYSMNNSADPRIDKIIPEIRGQLSQLDWPTGEALFLATMANLAMMRDDRTNAMKYRDQSMQITRRCGNRFVEYFAKSLIDGAEQDSASERRERLETSLASLRSVIDSDGQLYVPMTARMVILAMIAFGELETAVRCSTIVESLRGFGGNDEFSHEYQPALKAVKSELGQERFEQLRQEGVSLTPADIVELGTKIVASLDDKS